jgi:hypothetical protein
MTREEKIEQLTNLINISGNTTKLIRFILIQAATNLPAEEEGKIDDVIAILLGE